MLSAAGTSLGLLLCGAAVPPENRDRAEVLLRWVAHHSNPTQVRPADVPGIELEWDEEWSSLLSAEEVGARWRAVEDKPDHPDRNRLLLLRRCLEQRVASRFRLLYAGSDAWLLEERDADGRELRRGGLGGERWMLYRRDGEQAQLTVIHSGIPFPGGFNVSRYHDMAVEKLRRFFHYRLPVIGLVPDPGSVVFEGETWRLALRGPGSGGVMLSGDWPAPRNEPRALGLRWLDGGESASGVPPSMVFVPATTGDASAPISGFVEDRGDGVRVRATRRASKRVGRDEVERACVRPVAASDWLVRDWSDRSVPHWENYRDSLSVTWVTHDGVDRFAITDPMGIPPPARASSSPAPAAEGSPGRSWGWFISVVLVGLVIVIIPVIVHRTMRGNT
ncbi:MAG: hypothetical protein JNM07_07500 [Phycisphaerae bacterium]|nr:hypothetical protein [Phycisphaerae bacterium]